VRAMVYRGPTSCASTGIRSELSHHGITPRFGQHRAEVGHHALDPFIVVGPWVVTGAAAVWARRQIRRAQSARR
jgi:hypothetical protein